VADKIEQSGDSVGASFMRHRLDGDIKRCMVDVLQVKSPREYGRNKVAVTYTPHTCRGVTVNSMSLISNLSHFYTWNDIQAAIPKLHRKRGYFDLFGLDFMVAADPTTCGTSTSTSPGAEKDYKLWLLELNTNPALTLGKGSSIACTSTVGQHSTS